MLQWLKYRGLKTWLKFKNAKELIDKNISIGSSVTFVNQEIDFDGSSGGGNQILFPSSIFLRNFTFYLKNVTLDDVSSIRCFLSSTVYTNRNYFWTNLGDTLYVTTDLGSSATSDSGVGMQNNVAYDLAVTNENNVVKFYVNGSKHGANKSFATPNPLSPDILGRRGDDSYRVDGSFGELIIFDQALSAGEIKQIYDKNYISPYSNLVAQLGFTSDEYDIDNVKLISEKDDWQLGDGSTSTTYPGKLKTKGISIIPSPASYIQTSTQTNFPIGNSAVSIVLHFKKGTNQALEYLFFYGGNANDKQHGISVVNGQLRHAGFGNDISTDNLVEGEEYVVVYTYDGTNSGTHQGEKFYINGKNTSIASISGGGVFDIDLSNFSSIGVRNYNSAITGASFVNMFEVQLHSKALNPSEVLAITNDLKSKRGLTI